MDTPETILDSAEAAKKQYADATIGTQRWAAAWDALNQVLESRWNTTKAMVDLDALVAHGLELARLAPDHKRGTLWLTKRLSTTADICCDLQRQRDADIHNAIILFQRALVEAPANKPAMVARFRSRIAQQLLCSADAMGDDETGNKVLEAALMAEMSVTGRVEHDACRAGLLSILGITLRRKYGLLGTRIDLVRSIWAIRGALKAERVGGRDGQRLILHQNLETLLRLQFDAFGDPRDLDESIEESRLFLEDTTNETDNATFAHRCHTLADSLTARARLNGKMDDLDTAMSLLQDALKPSRPAGACMVPKLHTAIARVSQARYEITNQMEYLLSAIAAANDAMALFGTFDDRTIKASVCHLMIILYTRKYWRTKRLCDALKGLRFGEKSLAYQEPGAAARGEHLSQMATLYEAMFHISKPSNKNRARKYLEQGIAKAQESLLIKPKSALVRNDIARQLFTLYGLDKRPATLGKSAYNIELALSATEDLHIDAGSVMGTAGKIFTEKYTAAQKAGQKSEADKYLARAADCFLQAARHPGNLPLKRIKEACWAADLLLRLSRWTTAYALLNDTMAWVTKLYLYPVHTNSDDQQRILTSLSGLTADACSAGIMCGKVRDAVEILERGRGILVANSHKALPDIDDLRKKEPVLVERYYCVRDQLLGISAAGKTLYDKEKYSPDRDLSNRATALNKEMDEVFRQIRSIPGLYQLLQPIQVNEMQEMCSGKTVVALNTSSFGSHAIFVTRDRIWSISLPRSGRPSQVAQSLLEGQKLIERIAHPDKSESGEASARHDDEALLGLFSLLWHHVAKPVARQLGFFWAGEQPLDADVLMSRRILWLPTGVYCRLPIHAAGLHRENLRETLMTGHAVLSSYIASFRMLQLSQDTFTASLSSSTPRKGLVLSMEPALSATGSLPLGEDGSKVGDDVSSVSRSAIDWEIMQRPTSTDALGRMPACSWLHVDSNGVLDTNGPSASHPRLQGDDTSTESGSETGSRLTVQQISELQVTEGIVAFLSAGPTAESSVGPLLVGNLAVAHAFQVAGFPHIVGSLWPATDIVCPLFATYFYRYIFQYGPEAGQALSSGLIAFCVHNATVSVMLRLNCIYKQKLNLWAGFMHIGP